MLPSSASNHDLITICLSLLALALTSFLFSFLTKRLSARSLKRIRKQNLNSSTLRYVGLDAERIPAHELKPGDVISVDPYQIIPADGIVIDGVSAVDESAITGESAPVIREPQDERKFVTAGTCVLTSRLLIEVTKRAGDRFIDELFNSLHPKFRKPSTKDHLIQIFVFYSVIAITPLIAIFLFMHGLPFELEKSPLGFLVGVLGLTFSIIPFLSVGILDQLSIWMMKDSIKKNLIPRNVDTLEKLAKCQILVLDKTGTLTAGDRKATDFIPLPGISEVELARAAQVASLSDETPEGRSIVVLAKEKFGIRTEEIDRTNASYRSFSSETQMSGITFFDPEGDSSRTIMKGSANAICDFVLRYGVRPPSSLSSVVRSITETGSTPILVCDGPHILGAVCLQDEIKGSVKSHLHLLKSRFGIRTVLLTGDHSETSSHVARIVGADQVIAGATPDQKLEAIRKFQIDGMVVCMVGDGTNDAPAMAQADIAIAMNSGSHTAREAGNIVDLESRPTKILWLIELVQTHHLLRRVSLRALFLTSFVNLILICQALATQNERLLAVISHSIWTQIICALVLWIVVTFGLNLNLSRHRILTLIMPAIVCFPISCLIQFIF